MAACVVGLTVGLGGVSGSTLPVRADTMANPASEFCVQHGGRIEIETIANGGQKGVCVFPDGRRVDEWAYFRNAHRTTH